MTGDIDPVSTGARELRALTAAAADGNATRARVLAVVARRARRGRALRGIVFAVGGGLLLVSSAAAGLMSYTVARRASRPVAIAVAPAPQPRLRSGSILDRPLRTIPAVAAIEGDHEEPRRPERDSENRAYGRAHQLHFFGGPPARALAAWDDYLRRFPGGALAPEARFNRALCLIRLGRLAEANQALSAFVARAPGSYRRDEARRLQEWLARRSAP